MNLIIHRGTHQIGGTCIELQSGKSKILIDFGLPIVDENKEPFDFKRIKNKSKENLLKTGILPKINGLYDDEQPDFDGILLSHSHQDHYGLLSYVNPRIPVYLSKGSKILIEASRFFNQTDCDVKNFKTKQSWKQFEIGDFTITPYLVDHSGFDAFAYLIECENKRIFYSGDFSGHGRKKILYDNMVKNSPKNIDYLILEGTMIDRDKGKYEYETDIETELVNLFKNYNKMFFIACSSQNIDRLVSVYRACKRTNRIFVIDPYTAYILDKLKDVSSNIPQFDWKEKIIRIFFVPNSYTDKIAKDKSLFKFKSAKITLCEIKENQNKIVIKDSFLTRKILVKIVNDSKLIYSMWEGHLTKDKRIKEFWDGFNIPIMKIHCSGHAYIEELEKFVKALNPKCIIPNHTENPEKFSELFGDKVRIVKDKETIEL